MGVYCFDGDRLCGVYAIIRANSLSRLRGPQGASLKVVGWNNDLTDATINNWIRMYVKGETGLKSLHEVTIKGSCSLCPLSEEVIPASRMIGLYIN